MGKTTLTAAVRPSSRPVESEMFNTIAALVLFTHASAAPAFAYPSLDGDFPSTHTEICPADDLEIGLGWPPAIDLTAFKAQPRWFVYPPPAGVPVVSDDIEMCAIIGGDAQYWHGVFRHTYYNQERTAPAGMISIVYLTQPDVFYIYIGCCRSVTPWAHGPYLGDPRVILAPNADTN